MSGKSITQVYWSFKKDSPGLEVSRDHGARQVQEDDFRNFDFRILSFDDSNVADLKFPGRMMVALEQK